MKSNQLPIEGLVRMKQLLQVIPWSETRLKAAIRSGEFPAGKKMGLGGRSVVWNVEAVRAFIAAVDQK